MSGIRSKPVSRLVSLMVVGVACIVVRCSIGTYSAKRSHIGSTPSTSPTTSRAQVKNGFSVERDEPQDCGSAEPRPSFISQPVNLNILPGALNRAWEHSARMRREMGGSRLATMGTWEELGPGNIGGRIRSIVIHPTQPLRMWVGTVSGGIWRSDNGGANWSSADDSLANLAISCLVMAPSDPMVMYAGTGEQGFPGASSTSGLGVLKSMDGGVTWPRLGKTGSWSNINRIAVDALDADHLLVATTQGVFLSTDGGDNWSGACSGGTTSCASDADCLISGTCVPMPRLTRPAGIADVDFHPSVPTMAVAGGFDGTIWWSGDGGSTWTQSNITGISAPATRVELAYYGRTPLEDIVWASVEVCDVPMAPQCNGYILRSGDGGRNFITVSKPNHIRGAGTYNQALWVAPNNPCVLVAGGRPLFRSTDCGVTFQIISPSHGDQHIVVHHPDYDGSTNKTVFVANDGGVFRSNDILLPFDSPPCTDQGDCQDDQICHQFGVCAQRDFGWVSLNHDLGVTQFFYGAVNRAGNAIGGTQDNGCLRFTGGFNSWTTLPSGGGDGWLCAADPLDSRYLYYVGNSFPNIVRSADGGMTDMVLPGSPNAFGGLVLDPINPNRLFAAVDQLFVHANIKAPMPAASGWTVIKDFLNPGVTPVPWGDRISAMAVADGDPSVVWVVHRNGDVYRTRSLGESACPTPTCPNCACWQKVDDDAMGNPLLPNGVVCSSVAIDRNDHNRLYLTFGPWNFQPNLVWETTNGMDDQPTWTRIDGGTTCNALGISPATALPCEPMRVITVHPNQPGWLYVGTWFGLYASEDSGATWVAVEGLPDNVLVNDLDWQDETTLVVSTHGRGMWRGRNIVPDCNGDGISDHLELTENDCNGNFLPDDCDPDCDDDGAPDACEIGDALTLTTVISITVGEDAASLASDDLNGDGFLDFVVANRDSSDISVVLNRGRNPAGDWLGFADAVQYPLFVDKSCTPFPADLPTPWAVTLSDFDCDGDPDIAYTAHAGCPTSLLSDLEVLLNHGDGSFTRTPVGPVLTGVGAFRSEALAAADLNGDFAPDVVIANTRTTVGQLSVAVAFNAGNSDKGWRGFHPPLTPNDYPAVGRAPSSIVLARFNADAPVDLATANTDDASITTRRNQGVPLSLPGGLTRIELVDRLDYDVGGAPSSIAAGDLNGDRLLDLAVANGTASVFVLLNRGAGIFQSPVGFDVGAADVHAVAITDINRDGAADLVTASSVLLNDGTGNFSSAIPANGLAGAVSLVAADVDRDGDDDLAMVAGSRLLEIVLNDVTLDCDGNGVPDGCDLAAGRSDSDGDGLLDDCERSGCDADVDGDCDLADFRVLHGCAAKDGFPCHIGSPGGPIILDPDTDYDFDLRDYGLLQNEFTSVRDCCASHGPGCVDFDVARCVCAVLPTCCANAWTDACVSAVIEEGCGRCDSDDPCGDGTCASDENCVSCPEDCGGCAGECCAVHGTFGCDDSPVQSCVCGLRPECCDQPWSETCVDIAASACRACCGNGTCEVGEVCWDCPADCGQCTPQCGNDRCESGENCVTCIEDCRTCPGSCCTPHATVGCSNPSVQQCVCGLNPTCCEQGWHDGCAALADQCGSCDGDCCNTHENPGCALEAVELCVCSMDESCCLDRWHDGCAVLAAVQCGPCAGNCGDNSCDENETCASCSQDCGECQGSCCTSHAGPGCSNLDVQNCVCSFDARCCSDGWDAQCAMEADQCGSCNGDCCEAHNNPGCGDAQIETCVCEQFTFCCDVQWNENCVGLVNALSCGTCP